MQASKDPTIRETLHFYLRDSLPLSAATCCMNLMQVVDVAVVGRCLGTDQLAVRRPLRRRRPSALSRSRPTSHRSLCSQAVCFVIVVVNLTLEPASFITANAVTTLCGDSLSSQNGGQVGSSVRAAVLFCLLLTLPIGGLLLATPDLLSLLAVSPNVLSHVGEYAPAYVLVVAPALLLSADLYAFSESKRRVSC